MARAYGLYLDKVGITDRATVWIDAQGVVQHASSVTPSGERDLAELAALCERLDGAYSGAREPFEAPPGVAPGSVLYVRDRCGFSRSVRVALENLRLKSVEIRNVSRDEEARRALREVSGAETAPCLVIEGEPVRESAQILTRLADCAAPL